MTHYVPTSGEVPAEKLSGALFALARPVALQPPEAIQDAFSVIEALNGTHWLVVPDEFTLVMHPDAEIDGIADVLQPWEQSGALPAGTVAGIDAWINTTRVLPTIEERTFCPWEQFTAYFRANAKTWQQMIDAGLLAAPEVMP